MIPTAVNIHNKNNPCPARHPVRGVGGREGLAGPANRQPTRCTNQCEVMNAAHAKKYTRCTIHPTADGAHNVVLGGRQYIFIKKVVLREKLPCLLWGFCQTPHRQLSLVILCGPNLSYTFTQPRNLLPGSIHCGTKGAANGLARGLAVSLPSRSTNCSDVTGGVKFCNGHNLKWRNLVR